jgi:hypothetical protein
MALDASIILAGRAPQIDDPLTVQAKRATLADLMGRQQRQQFEMEGLQSERQAQQTLADLYRTAGNDPQALMQGMAQQGLGSRIPAFQQQQATLGKATAENEAAKLKVAQDRIKIVGARLSSRLANPNVTPEDVIGDITSLVQEGVIDQAQGARMARDLPGDPGRLRQALIAQGMELMGANERINLALGDTAMQDMGGQRQAFTTNRIQGTVTPTGSALPKTATPEALLIDARTRSEGAANRAVTIRGQNMVDARAGAAVEPPKPLPASALKLQNEALSALGGFKNVDADLEALEQQIAEGKLEVGPVARAGAFVRSNLNRSTENDRNLSSLQTKLEGMRNAILLLGKGVQTEGDAKRAMDEIIKNLNDQELLKQRIPELRAKVRRDADLQRSQVDLLRSNYGQPQMDFSKFDPRPASVNLPKPGGPTPNAGGATVQLPNGQTLTFPSAEAAAAFRKEAGL